MSVSYLIVSCLTVRNVRVSCLTVRVCYVRVSCLTVRVCYVRVSCLARYSCNVVRSEEPSEWWWLRHCSSPQQSPALPCITNIIIVWGCQTLLSSHRRNVMDTLGRASRYQIIFLWSYQEDSIWRKLLLTTFLLTVAGQNLLELLPSVCWLDNTPHWAHTLLLLQKRETKTSPLTQSAYRQPLFYLLDQVEKYPGLISCHM